jgi:hypothetical protein
MPLNLQARAIKATLVLDPVALAGVTVPNGQAKYSLHITVAGRTIAAELNAKSLRRCVAAIDAAGPENVAVVLSGKLEGNTLIEAGIAAQPKAPAKVEAAAAA